MPVSRWWGVACVVGWLSATPAHAQEPVALSLDDALRLAQERSEQLTITSAAVERAEGNILQVRSAGLPQITGAASWQHTFASEFDDLFDVPDVPVDGTPGGGTPGGGTVDGGAGAGDGFANLPFGQDDTWRIDLNFAMVLWSGGQIRAAIQAAKSRRDAAELDEVQQRAVVALETARAYFDTRYYEHLVASGAEAVGQAERTLAQTEVGFQVGAQPEFDVLRARVEVSQRQLDLVRAERDLDNAVIQLRQLIDLPADVPLRLTTPLAIEEVDPTDAPVIADIPPEIEPRIAVQAAETLVDAQEWNLRAARRQWMPQLSATGLAEVVAYPQNVFPPLDPNDWRENVWAGLNLDVPIFTGFRIRGDVRVAEADLLESEARLSQTAELADLDTADAIAELDAARSAWEATNGIVDQARRAYDIAEVRFQQGISAQVELSDARVALQQAQANRALAIRHLLLAQIRLALLPALPVGTGAVQEILLGSVPQVQSTRTTIVAPTIVAPTPTTLPMTSPTGGP